LNDPHVVSLTYGINKAETVDFDKAPPLTVDRGAFRVTIDAYTSKIELVDHFASVEEARNLVEPFLRAWELEADLRDSRERFRSPTKRQRSLIEIPPHLATLLFALK
jgi:hypothetical protein